MRLEEKPKVGTDGLTLVSPGTHWQHQIFLVKKEEEEYVQESKQEDYPQVNLQSLVSE